MGSHEILTLQFGHYSNFVGAHWWNVQEAGFEYDQTESEINHDVLYREGLSPDGKVTFTPRALLVDLKGSLKALPEDGGLYGGAAKDKSTPAWQSKLEVKERRAEEKTGFQKELDAGAASKAHNLDEEVRVWSDFLYTRFHPRTIHVIKEYQHGSDAAPFDLHPSGSNLWKTPGFEEDFADKIRNYVEECDGFQGFHVLLDAADGFGGLSVSCLEHLSDDYASKSVLAFPVIPQRPQTDGTLETDEEIFEANKRDGARLVNLALCFEGLAEHASLFVPLSTGTGGFRQFSADRQFNHVVYDGNLPYHSSAILASALETATLSYRLKKSDHVLADVCRGLSSNGRKASAASVCLPFSLNRGQDLIDCLNNWQGAPSRSLTPNCEVVADAMVHLYSLRGVPQTRLKRPVKQAGKQKDLPAFNCNTVKDMLGYYLECSQYVAVGRVTAVEKPLAVTTPFPKIFDSSVGLLGDVDPFSKGAGGVASVPVLAGLHQGVEVGGMLGVLGEEVKRVNYACLHQFREEGVDCDEFKDRLEKLLSLGECYDERNYFV